MLYIPFWYWYISKYNIVLEMQGKKYVLTEDYHVVLELKEVSEPTTHY